MFDYNLVQVYSNTRKDEKLGEINAHFQPSSDRVLNEDGKLVEADLKAFTEGALVFEIKKGNVIIHDTKEYLVLKVKDWSVSPIPHAEILLKRIED